MLHAINQRKAKLAAFRGAGERVPLEDLVTSTVFGSLMFLRADDRTIMLDRLFTGLGLEGFQSGDSAQVALWRKRETDLPGSASRAVEPDVEISTTAGSTVLIEVKWGAPLHQRQLSSQWLSIQPRQRKRARHLLLVTEPAKYLQSVADCREVLADQNVREWPLQVRSWRAVADLCRRLSIAGDLDPGARSWAREVHAFLRREDPDALLGWSQLGLDVEGVPLWRFGTPGWPASTPAAVSWRFA